MAIPDATVLQLWQNDAGFRKWCNNTLFPAELAVLIEKILHRSERATYGLQDVLTQCVGHAQLVPANPKEWTDDLKDRTLFVASANSANEIGDVLGFNNSPPETSGPLALRPISLPMDSLTP